MTTASFPEITSQQIHDGNVSRIVGILNHPPPLAGHFTKQHIEDLTVKFPQVYLIGAAYQFVDRFGHHEKYWPKKWSQNANPNWAFRFERFIKWHVDHKMRFYT